MDKKMISTNRKVVTFGEVMLRLTAPDFRRFSQTNEFIATYGGSEANVAVSLANFGIPTEFVTRLPDNAMAQACIASLRANGLGTEGIVFGGKRMGLYFLESGAFVRQIPMWYTICEGSFFCHPASRHDRLGKDICRCRLVSLVGHSGFTVTRGCRRLSGSSTNGRPHGLNHFL